MASNRNGSITADQFVLKAITVLARKNKVNPNTGQQYKGIHVVYSGFNEAFALQFPNLADGGQTTNPKTGKTRTIRASELVTRRMAEAGQIVVVSSFGGATLYLPGDAPDRSNNEARAKATLAEILS